MDCCTPSRGSAPPSPTAPLWHGRDVDQGGKADVAVSAFGASEGGPSAGRVRIHAAELCGAIVSYGAGCSGTAGLVPTLDGTGCPVSHHETGFAIENAIGGQTALLFLDTQATNLPLANGCTLLVLAALPPVALPVFGPPTPGLGLTKVSFTLPELAAPLDVFLQAAISDPGVPHGYVLTNGVQLSLVP